MMRQHNRTRATITAMINVSDSTNELSLSLPTFDWIEFEDSGREDEYEGEFVGTVVGLNEGVISF